MLTSPHPNPTLTKAQRNYKTKWTPLTPPMVFVFIPTKPSHTIQLSFLSLSLSLCLSLIYKLSRPSLLSFPLITPYHLWWRRTKKINNSQKKKKKPQNPSKIVQNKTMTSNLLYSYSYTYTTKHGTISIFLLFLFLSLSPPQITAQPSPPDPYNNAQFSPSMAIIVVVLIAALFFMGFVSIYIRHCSDDQAANSLTGRQLAATRRVARGLDSSVIETFPTLNYSVVKGLKIGKGALECAVCLNEFEDDETLRLIPKCDHVFHPECIDEWLASHTTCPVCRANLVPQPGEPVPELTELTHESPDLEAQNTNTEQENVNAIVVEVEAPEIMKINQKLNRNRTRGSRSGTPRKFPRSHSTGHSLVQPGENTDRFTLRLPVEVRKQVMRLNRANSMVVLPSEGSSRRGYRTGGEGSSRGKSHRRLEKLDSMLRSDRWVFSMAPPFFSRASSLRSPKVAANDDVGTSVRSSEPGVSSSRPPV